MTDQTGRREYPTTPMKYSDGAGLEHVEKYIRDDKWVFEQKMDGTRGLAVVGTSPSAGNPDPLSRVWWPGRGGRGALAHSAATQHFAAINPTLSAILGGTPGLIVFDGEIMNTPGDPATHGQYHLFDVPYMRIGGVEVIRPSDPYLKRRTALHAPDLHQLISNTRVKVVRMARSRRDKREMLDAVIAGGGEGVMAKHLDHQYLPGARSEFAVKVKLVKSADVIVTSFNRPDARHGSATLGVLDPRLGPTELIPVGACSLIGKPQVSVGDVIEVAYLNWTGSALYQPRMTRVRTDKLPEDCTMAQFRPYSRRVV